MKRVSFWLSSIAITALIAGANAQSGESVTYNNVNSNGPIGHAVNELRNYTATGSYTMRSMEISGQLRRVHSDSYASEALIRITAPNGAQTTFRMFAQTTFTTIRGSGRIYTVPFAPVGNWTFRFYESYDDGGTGNVDAVWDYITFDYRQDPTGLHDFGTLTSAGDSVVRSLSAREILWYQLVVPVNITAASGFSLEINTVGSTNTAGSTLDTEIAVYDTAGNKIAENDDASGIGLLSRLVFGAGGSADLTAGTYYIGAGGFNTEWSNVFVSSTSSYTGDLQLNLITNVPEPASMLVLGAGLAGLLGLRRRKR